MKKAGEFCHVIQHISAPRGTVRGLCHGVGHQVALLHTGLLHGEPLRACLTRG